MKVLNSNSTDDLTVITTRVPIRSESLAVGRTSIHFTALAVLLEIDFESMGLNGRLDQRFCLTITDSELEIQHLNIFFTCQETFLRQLISIIP